MPEARDEEAGVKLSVIVPVYNEEAALPEVIADIRAALADWPHAWELLVVDDASTDGTAASAEEAEAVVLRSAENAGYGAAVKKGLARARGELVALLDGDGSYPPSALLELLAFADDVPQVVGVRNRESGRLKWLRAAAKWVVRKLAEWIAGRRIPDLNSGMRVFRRDVMLRYLWVLPDGFSCSSSMTLAFVCNAHAIRYVPIDYRPRCGNSKFRPVRDGAAYATTVLRMVTYFRPLRVFLPVALVLAAAAVIKGAWDIWGHPTGLHDSDVILAVASLMVFLMGLLADLIVAQRRQTCE